MGPTDSPETAVWNYPYSLLNRLAKRFVFESPSVDERSLVIWQLMWRVRGKIGFGEFDRSVGMCLEVDPRLRGWLGHRPSSNHNLHRYITLTYSFCSHQFGYPCWHTDMISFLAHWCDIHSSWLFFSLNVPIMWNKCSQAVGIGAKLPLAVFHYA